MIDGNALFDLVRQFEVVMDSGDPLDFKSQVWLTNWLAEPLPAFGGVRPLDLADTPEGQARVATMLTSLHGGSDT